jgi:2-keto-4-pentenoate hydratase
MKIQLDFVMVMGVATVKVLAMDLEVGRETVKRREETVREKDTVQDLAMKTGLVLGSVMVMVMEMDIMLVKVLVLVVVKEVVTVLVLEGGIGSIGSRCIFL